MQFSNMIEKIMSQPTKIKILRFLVLYKPEMTGRELARFCSVSHMQVYRIMQELELQGIATKIRVGKSNLFKLNEKNIIVKMFLKDIFEKEKNLLKIILGDVLYKVENKILSATVFGSVAEGKERPNSDVDICVLVKDKNVVKEVKKELAGIEVEFYEQTGNRLSPIVLSRNEFQRKSSTNKALYSKIIMGKTIVGKPIGDYINGR